MLKYLSLVMLIFLSACTSMPEYTVTDAMRQQKTWAEQQTSWNINGRIAVDSPDENGQADIFWDQQSPHQYRIRMVAPFGGGTTLLDVKPDGAAVTLPNGKSYYADSADELLSQGGDWALPVKVVRYWLFGLPAPHYPVYKLELNTDQLPVYLEQSNWKIRFKSYKRIQGHWLPGKLFMQKTDEELNRVDVRLVIRHWRGLQ